MAFSVFTRHSFDCKFKRDRSYRRCNCPKWVGGQVDKEYFRQSASTRVWDEAEFFRDKLEEALDKGLPPFGPQPTETSTETSPQVSPMPLPPAPVAAALPVPKPSCLGQSNTCASGRRSRSLA